MATAPHTNGLAGAFFSSLFSALAFMAMLSDLRILETINLATRSSNRNRSRRRALTQPDRAVVGQRPVRIVGDLPHVALWIGERTCVAAPFGARGRAPDRSAGALNRREQGVDFLWCPDVVRQFNPGRTVTTERGPQTEDHSPGLV